MKLIFTVLSAFGAVTLLNGQEIIPSFNLIPPSSFGSPIFHTGANPGIVLAPQVGDSLVNPAVVRNAAAEAQLPQELQNPFYKNPAIAAGLAKASWFTNKEFPVHHREAEKISRSEIIKLVRRIQHTR